MEENEKKLIEVIEDLAKQTAGLNAYLEAKEKAEEEQAKIAEAVEKQKAGTFQMWDTSHLGDDPVKGFIEKELGRSISRLGLRLMDKQLRGHKYRIEDHAVREQIAKYMVLFVEAAVKEDYRARQLFDQEYGHLRREKTAIGDPGNLWPMPDVVEDEVVRFAREESLILQQGTVVEMGPGKLSLPVESAGVSVTWSSTAAASDPTITEVELDPQEVGAYSTVRNKTLYDANYDIVSWLTELFAEAMGLELDNQAWNGTGNPCSGLLTAWCGHSVVMGAGSTSFANTTADLLSEMIQKLDGRRKQNASFHMHGLAMHYVRTLKDSNGRPIFYEPAGNKPPTIYGFPYYENTKCPGTDAANTAFLTFGNLRYFWVGRRVGSMALHVDPYGLFVENKTRFKLWNMWDLEAALTTAFVRMLTHS